MATAVEPSPPSALCKQVSQGSLFGPDSVEPGTDLQDVGTLRCQRRLPQEASCCVFCIQCYIHACLCIDGRSRFRLRFHTIHPRLPAILPNNPMYASARAIPEEECLSSATMQSTCCFRDTGARRTYTRVCLCEPRVRFCRFGIKCARELRVQFGKNV